MLVLTRRHNEAIVIQYGGETITIKVLRINQEHIRLGIDAGKAVKVDREEIYKDKQKENGHGK